MPLSISTSHYFTREFKRLSKKYPSLIKEIIELRLALEGDPEMGESLGGSRYKIRLSIKSKNSGKSGGAHVITLVKKVDDQLILLAIYDKSEIDSLEQQKTEEAEASLSLPK